MMYRLYKTNALDNGNVHCQYQIALVLIFAYVEQLPRTAESTVETCCSKVLKVAVHNL